MITNRFLPVALVCAAVATALAGCGGGISVPRTVPTSGSVLVKGKAAEGVKVTFNPQFDMGAVKFTPSGVTNKDGKFVLNTAAPGDGAPRGEYTVTFELLKAGADKRGLDTEIDVWKGKYANPAASKFKVQIDGAAELEPFRLD